MLILAKAVLAFMIGFILTIIFGVVFIPVLKKMNITPAYKSHEPLRSIFKPLAKLPLLREMFIKMVVCVIEKR